MILAVGSFQVKGMELSRVMLETGVRWRTVAGKGKPPRARRRRYYETPALVLRYELRARGTEDCFHAMLRKTLALQDSLC